MEADEEQAEKVAEWFKAAMVEAMTPLVAPLQVEVEVKVSTTWGGS